MVLSHSVKENNILPILKKLSFIDFVIDEKESQEVTKKNVSDFNIKTSSIDKKSVYCQAEISKRLSFQNG